MGIEPENEAETKKKPKNKKERLSNTKTKKKEVLARQRACGLFSSGVVA
jgi:hypothetical protein